MRYTFFVTLLFCIFSATAQHQKFRNDSEQEKMDLAPATVYTYVEQMPEPAYDINKYISESVRYPDAAVFGKVQGRVVVKFVVNEDGSISDCEIKQGIGSGCDEEAIRVLRNMPKWKPGIHNGLPVRVSTMQPITFTIKEPEQIYSYVEHQPDPGYDVGAYLRKNLKYPYLANSRNVEGTVIVKFVVNKNGSIVHGTIVRGIGYGCDEEALRVVMNMPSWEPGSQNGKPVNVYFTLPIQFKLTNENNRRR